MKNKLDVIRWNMLPYIVLTNFANKIKVNKVNKENVFVKIGIVKWVQFIQTHLT